MYRFIYLFIFIALAINLHLKADNKPSFIEPVHAELIKEQDSIKPGDPFWVAVKLNIDDKWHSYWKNPGDSGFPITIEWALPEGIEAGPIEWPYPERIVIGEAVNFGYEKEVVLLTKMTPSKDLSLSAPVKIDAVVRWLVCSDSNCLPGESEVTANFPVSSQPPTTNPKWPQEFTTINLKLPKKQWEMTAVKVGHKINIFLKAPEGQNTELTDAYFSPEKDILVHYKETGTFTKLSENPDHYVLTLDAKPHPLIANEQSHPLKGILVARNQAKPEESSLALDIDLLYKSIAPSHPPFLNTNEDDVIPLVPLPENQGKILDAAEPPVVHMEWEGGLGLALLFAFMGGMILNLMPCVLPVISLKVLSFVKMSGQSRALTFKHGMYFALGVLISFWVLAGILLVLQAYGRTVGWGFQLQEPLFVGGLAAVLIVFGLSLFGVFELGTVFASWAGQTESNTKKENSGLSGSFFSGVLATAVATPCTGPFLGTALGFAVTLAPLLSLLIFTSLGLGMAFPYLILAAFPAMTKVLPKPGPWMITFKEIMGFFMLATVLWLIWVFGAQTSSFAVFVLLAGFLSLSIACWIYGKWASPMRKKATRMLSTILASLFLILGFYGVVAATQAPIETSTSQNSQGWIPFSKEKIVELQSQGIPVLVDFTAKWCLICQTNHMIFLLPEVSKKLEDLGVVKMLADWTRNDQEITEALRSFGRNGVPLYVLYGTDSSKPPQILPQVLTSDNVIESLNKIN